MLKRVQSILFTNKRNIYKNHRNPSIESWNVYTKAKSYSQESINQIEKQQKKLPPPIITEKEHKLDQQIDQYLQLGIKHHELGQLEKATHYFRLASKEGCPIGMFLYGISLRHGWGCKINTTLAFQYLQTAAEYAVNELLVQNNIASKGELVISIYEMAVCFQQGWGVAKNKETAFYYFEIAANLGDLDAMNDVAFCYTHGHGVKKNLYKAAEYYRVSSRRGQGQVGNSWIWKEKYNVVDQPDWENKIKV